MTLQESILTQLTENGGGPLSGECMARALGVTRAAIWKGIRALTAEGYPIVAEGRHGYRLCEGGPLSAAMIRALLPAEWRSMPIFVYTKTDSTNTRARLYAEEQLCRGQRFPAAFLAEAQTGGRGRRGRSFASEAGGLYLSLLLYPALPTAAAVTLTTYAAVQLAEVLEQTANVPVQIKWVNDLYLHGRKLCGILTEGTVDLERGGLSYAVLGMGINLRASALPAALRDIATSLEAETGRVPDRNRLAAALIARLLSRTDYGAADITAAYRARSLLTGREVEVLRADGSYRARVRGIGDDCSLLLTLPDGREESLQTGEVSVYPCQPDPTAAQP